MGFFINIIASTIIFMIAIYSGGIAIILGEIVIILGVIVLKGIIIILRYQVYRIWLFDFRSIFLKGIN
jgi:hypothetical protein